MRELSPGVFRATKGDVVGYTSLGVSLDYFKSIVNLQTNFWEILLNKYKANSQISWCIALGIHLYDFALSGLLPPSPSVVRDVLKVISNKENQPVLFHCRHNRERTGYIAAVYKMKVLGWGFNKAYQDWRDNGCRWVIWRLWRSALIREVLP